DRVSLPRRGAVHLRRRPRGPRRVAQEERTLRGDSNTGLLGGALPSVRGMTHDSELVLDPGDLLVLYSDGVTEARNTRHEQFSLERLVRLVEDSATKSVTALRDSILAAVTAWSASLDDDVTVVVLRYVGSVSPLS